MLSQWVAVAGCLIYVLVLFAVAYWVDRRGERGSGLLKNPYVYTLSLGAYATAWSFYGSTGLAAVSGVAFLPIHLGATLAALLWSEVLRRMVRVVRRYHVTSIADLAASRYGKSSLVGGTLAVMAMIGLVPYLALQLKAISDTFQILTGGLGKPASGPVAILSDTAFYAVVLQAAFAILFGARRLSPDERHGGLVAAVAVESVIKLVALLSVGIFVTFFLYDGFGDLFGQAAAKLPEYGRLTALGGESMPYSRWFSFLILSMLALTLLPSQFQLAVVENRDEKHLYHAVWLFPLYLLAINLFILPVAFAGLMRFPAGSAHPDTFVLALPMAFGPAWLVLLVFLGGLSAATAHVVISSLALSIMTCNNLALPLLLRFGWIRAIPSERSGKLVLYLRRLAILLLLALAYGYLRVAGSAYALVEIGLVSFVAVAQFGPAVLGGLYWRLGSRRGALAGLVLGFVVWGYTLLLPAFAKSGWLPAHLVHDGLFGLSWLKPLALFGLEGIDRINHGLFWSLLANTLAYVGVSLVWPPSGAEEQDAARFVDVLEQNWPEETGRPDRLVSAEDLHGLLARFLGDEYAEEFMVWSAREQGVADWRRLEPGADLVEQVENMLVGVVGAPSARILIESVLNQAPVSKQEVLEIATETSQVIAYSRRLEEQSRKLEALAAALQESEGRLDAIIENAPVVIFMKDPAGHYLLINRLFEESFHVTRETVKGKTDYDIFPAEFADAFVRDDRQMLATNKPLQIEETAPGSDGLHTYLTIKFPLRDVHGQVSALCGIATDISEVKEAEAAVRDLNHDLEIRAQQLEMVNKELEAFSYSVSHDLRAPLRSINGFSRILIDDYAGKLDDQGRHYLVRIHEASQRLSQLIDDMLSLSLVSRREMSREDIDLSEMVHAISRELHAGHSDRVVEFLIQEGVRARGDSRLLRVMLDNLLGNAWKYTSKLPAACVEFGTTRLADGTDAYFVRDNGAGFDMQYAGKLFTAFQRLHRSSEFPGTGIGLATVQRIVNRHGGRIWAEGAVGRGAVFYFTLTP